MDVFRASLPPEWRHLVIGPVRSVVNGDVSYVFLPDGSGSGWAVDEEGDGYRARFIALFQQRYEDGSSSDDVVSVTYGGDMRRSGCDPSLIAVYANDAKSTDVADAIEGDG